MLPGLFTPSHIAIALIVLLVIFGPKRLPEAGRALGRGIREFKDAIAGTRRNPSDAELEPPPRP